MVRLQGATAQINCQAKWSNIDGEERKGSTQTDIAHGVRRCIMYIAMPEDTGMERYGYGCGILFCAEWGRKQQLHPPCDALSRTMVRAHAHSVCLS